MADVDEDTVPVALDVDVRARDAITSFSGI